MLKKILIVDDEEMLGRNLEKLFNHEGFEADFCTDGAQAYDKIMGGDYDLLLTDYFMPGLKADWLCQDIREDGRFKNLIIIVMTAFENWPASYFIANGATDVIFKPFELEDLLEKVGKYLKPLP